MPGGVSHCERRGPVVLTIPDSSGVAGGVG